jgi:hypothetical protein
MIWIILAVLSALAAVMGLLMFLDARIHTKDTKDGSSGW